MRSLSFMLCVLFVNCGKAEPVTNVTIEDVPQTKTEAQIVNGDDKSDELPENTLEHDIATVLKELNLIPNNDTSSQQDQSLPADEKWNITRDFPTNHIEDDTGSNLQTSTPSYSITQTSEYVPPSHKPTYNEAPYHYTAPTSNPFPHFPQNNDIHKTNHPQNFQQSAPPTTKFTPPTNSKPHTETTLNTLNYYVPLQSHVVSKPPTFSQNNFPPQQWTYKPQSTSYDVPYTPANSYISGQPLPNYSPIPWSYLCVFFLTYDTTWSGTIDQAEIQQVIKTFANVESQEHHLSKTPENAEHSTATHNQFVPSQRLEYSSVYDKVGFPSIEHNTGFQGHPLNQQWTPGFTTPLNTNGEGLQTETTFGIIEPVQPFYPPAGVQKEVNLHNFDIRPSDLRYSHLIHNNPFLPPSYFSPIDFVGSHTPKQSQHPQRTESNAKNLPTVIVKSIDLTRATNGPVHAESAPRSQYLDPGSNIEFPLIPKNSDIQNTNFDGFSLSQTPQTPTPDSPELINSNDYSTIFRNSGPDYHDSSFLHRNVDYTTHPPALSYDVPDDITNYQNNFSHHQYQPIPTSSSSPMPLLTDEVVNPVNHVPRITNPNLIKCYFYKNGMLKRLKKCKIPRKHRKRLPKYKMVKDLSMHQQHINYDSIEDYVPAKQKQPTNLGTLHHIPSSEESEETPNAQKPTKFLLKTTVHYPSYCKKLPALLKNMLCS
ncbi:hypothetical protein RI129_000378 [Pyrocoelia pectoralis]|uniref:Uncharacterized protein n=1 Tax=Pyrocoelia pectoralis TaxID=417401 RepID=A0AAN7VT23_9COLE